MNWKTDFTLALNWKIAVISLALLTSCESTPTADDSTAASTTNQESSQTSSGATQSPSILVNGQCSRVEGLSGWGSDGATGTINGINLGELNNQFKNWTISGFDSQKTSNQNVGDFDTWAKARVQDGTLQTVIEKLPDGYALEVRGHIDRAESLGMPWPNSYDLSVNRASGVIQALVRERLDPQNRVCFSGVGTVEYLNDPDETSQGSSAKNRRVTFHIIDVTASGTSESAIQSNEQNVADALAQINEQRAAAQRPTDDGGIYFGRGDQTDPFGNFADQSEPTRQGNYPRFYDPYHSDNNRLSFNDSQGRYSGGPAPVPGSYSIQVGAFRNFLNAQKLRNRLSSNIAHPVYITEGNGWYKVVVGQFSSHSEASRQRSNVASLVREKVIVVRN